MVKAGAVLEFLVGTTPIESFTAAANVFLGGVSKTLFYSISIEYKTFGITLSNQLL